MKRVRVAVIGAGPSGVELTCKLADRLGDHGRIRLIDRNDHLLKQSTKFNQTAAQKALDQRGVWVDLDTSIQQINEADLVMVYKDQKDSIPVDLVLWTVGTAIAQPIQDLPVPHATDGRIRVDTNLQVIDHPTLFALGDLADGLDANQQVVPTTAQSALQQADNVAWNVWASLSGRSLLYLAGGAAAFEFGATNNFQVQYVRDRDALPLTRDYQFEAERRYREILNADAA